jgi:hypothetical protein|tara:strand:- start:6984 stop:7220 length:237 start_codon:yes stop_codon:yes gene_type:complete
MNDLTNARRGYLTFVDGDMRCYVEQGEYTVVATLPEFVAICGDHGARWSDSFYFSGKSFDSLTVGQKDIINHTASWNA